MPALTLINPIPQEVVILSVETIDQITAACSAAAQITAVTTPEQLHNADLCVKYLSNMAKKISDGRLALTRPLDDFKKQAIAAQESGCEPLLSRAKHVQALIKTYIDEQNRIRAEQMRLAEIERNRLQAIADAQAEEERQARQKALDDVCESEEDRQIVVVEPVRIQGPILPPPIKSMSTRAHVSYSLQWIDAAKVPVFSPQGSLLRPCDDTAVIKYLKTLPPGQREIPGGVRLIETEGTANKG